MEKRYFLTINSYNLAHYFSSALIAPSNYYNNRNKDLQNRFDNYLLLCNSKFAGESNCALEIALNEKEEFPKRITENFYLFDMPLPISRVKGIYFLNEKQKVTTEFNVTSGSAFIPQSLLFVADEKGIDISELDGAEAKVNPADWLEPIIRFDQLMGGFSLMNIARDKYQNYSSGYFSTLGYVNNAFRRILSEQNIETKSNFVFAFDNEGKFKDFHDAIYSDINFDVLKRFAKKDGVSIESRNGLIQIDKIPENKQTYLIAVIDSYGVNRRKKIDSFISDLVSGVFSKERSEGLAFAFGINKGYKSFRNRYKTEKFEISVKFLLNSQLDYYTIESIYQNVFNNLADIPSFSYIDSWCPRKSYLNHLFSGYDTFKVLDELVVLKKSEDLFEQLLRSSLDKKHRIFETLVERIASFFPGFVSIDEAVLNSMLTTDLDLLLREYAESIYKSTSKTFISEAKRIQDLEKHIESQNDIISDLRNQIKLIPGAKDIEGSHELGPESLVKEQPSEIEVANSDVEMHVFNNKDVQDSKNEKPKLPGNFRQSARKEKSIPIFDTPQIRIENTRFKELEKLSSKALKDIASRLSIHFGSKDTKASIIAKILKNEFKQ